MPLLRNPPGVQLTSIKTGVRICSRSPGEAAIRACTLRNPFFLSSC